MNASQNNSRNNMTNLKFFEKAIGKEYVLADETNIKIFSRDIMEWEAPKPDVILRPADTNEVSECVRIANNHDLFIAPRGGGLSYTKGYVPEYKGTAIIDLTRLNKIFEINAEDFFVVVGAGCTWKSLSDTLKQSGLRPAITGPISGIFSTIGGGASQNIPGSMDAFIGLEVVLANGKIIQTGSSASQKTKSSFYRNYGPDLTGLFLGDTGSYGIKTKICLRLQPIPNGVAFASYAFESLTNMARAMAEIARLGVASKTLGMDPLKNKTATKIDVSEGMDTLKDIVRDNSSIGKGMLQAFKVISSRKILDKIPWSLHLTVEGFNQASAESAIVPVHSICEKNHGQEIEATIPIALRAKPYSIRGFLGLQGERWVPVHGVFPLSRTDEIVGEVENFFASRKDRLERFQISHSFISSVNGPFWLLEPMFYWFDEVSDFHLLYLEKRKHKKLSRKTPNKVTRQEVIAIRNELKNLFFELGAINAQIGKYYNFANSLNPETYNVLTEIKKTLDPRNRLNPGNLGWL